MARRADRRARRGDRPLTGLEQTAQAVRQARTGRDGWRGCRALDLGKRAERTVPAIAHVDQHVERDGLQPLQLAHEDGLQPAARLLVIGVRAIGRLGDDLVHDAQRLLVDDAHLHGQGGRRRLVGRAPQDARAALRRDDRVDGVLEREHDVADRDRERAARAALAGDDRDDRRPRAGS